LTRWPKKSWPGKLGPIALLLCLIGSAGLHAQQLDLSHGGPIDITARDGIEWRQAEQQVIARGAAKAVRDNVTVTADRLTAWYRKRGGSTAGENKAPDTKPPAAQPAVTQPPVAQPAAAQPTGLDSAPTTEGNEVYRLQADGNVHIYTATDQAQGDKATYDMDQGVLVLTGRNLKLTTPNNVITARDDLEYWTLKHMAVARGDAVVVTKDAKRIAADTLVAYTTDNPPPNGAATPAKAGGKGPTDPADPLAASGKLQRVEAFGNVSIRTPTDTVTGDRGVYVPDTGMARLAGTVHITRGQNQLNGAEADVNMKTGIATLVAEDRGRVHGLVLPNDTTNKSLDKDSAAHDAAAPKPVAPQSGHAGGKAP
jgi:lipopolysaccharide export system protein LptA